MCLQFCRIRVLQYLWGIETAVESPLITAQSRFYSTYEELKLWEIEFTIPSLIVFTVPMRNWNQNVSMPTITIWLCFTVPMRNWNNTSLGCTIEAFKVLQYLWGIETQGIPSYHCLVSLVFTVPMRNWNESGCLSIGCFPICFYSTYEELKLCVTAPRNISCESFLQYLWGIETSRLLIV